MELNVIRRITTEAQAKGVDEAAAKLTKLGEAHDGVTVASQKTEKATGSYEAALEKVQRRYDQEFRAQKELAKVRKELDGAVAQGLTTQARASEIMQLATRYHNQASGAAKAQAQVVQDLQGKMQGLAGPLGAAGNALSAFGIGGLAAAAGVGAAVLAFNLMSSAAHDLAQKAQELRNFSEATGLTTAQVQALKSEGSKFGLSVEDIQTAVQQFTTRFDELRTGQGALLTQVRRLNPALADQMALATNAAAAMTMLGQALAQTDNIFERNALVKAAYGRGGLSMARFATGLDVDGLTKSYVDAGKALDDNLIQKLAKLEIDIAKTSAKAKQNIASIFSEDLLASEKKFADGMLAISEALKAWHVDPSTQKFVDTLAAIPAGAWNFLVSGPVSRWTERMKQSAESRGGFDEGGFTNLFPGRVTPSADQALRDQPAPGTNPRYDANKLRDQISAMGDAAPASMRLDHALQQLAISQKDAGLKATQHADAERVLRESFAGAALNARVGLIGDMATALEVETQKQYAINRAVREGASFTDDEIKQIKAKAVALFESSKIQNQLQFERAQLGRDAVEARVYEVLRQQGLSYNSEQGQIIASQVRINEELKRSIDVSTEFGQSLLSSLMQGKSGFDAISGSLAKIGQNMAQAGAKRFMTGMATGDMSSAFGNQNLMSANGALGMAGAGFAGYQSGSPLGGALGGAMAGSAFGPYGMIAGAIIGGVGGLLGQDSQAQQKRDQEAQQRAQKMAGYQERAAMAGAGNVDTNTLEGALKVFDIKAGYERLNENDATASRVLERAQEQERLNIIEEFGKKAVEAEKAKQEAILQRQTDYADRLFAAMNDSSTKEGALAAFDRQAEQQRQVEQKAGGEALSDLEKTLVAERLNIIKDFDKQAIQAEQERADKMIAISKQITDYLNGLKLGALSALSPEQQLATARSSYEQQLSLARGGDQTALGGITQAANPYLEQLRSFYGPSQIYGAFFTQIAGELERLAAGITGGSSDLSYQAANALPNAASAGGGTSSAIVPVTPTIVSASQSSSSSDKSAAAIEELSQQVSALRAELAHYAADRHDQQETANQGIDGIRTDFRLNAQERKIRSAVG